MFEKIKRWYEKGFWSDQMVQNAVIKEVLTQEQVDSILKFSFLPLEKI